MNSNLSTATTPSDLGQVLETVHAQQSQIHGMLATLDTRSRDLDSTMGEAVQRAFMDAAGLRAAEKLSQIHRATGMRFALWSFGIVSACSLVPTVLPEPGPAVCRCRPIVARRRPHRPAALR
jgi:hypothetical protein